ncbi:MAG: hypothetical protein E7318_06580 [Clostridiales bacterium]|nr:hypothetical protein [Clostridiales bacterium]
MTFDPNKVYGDVPQSFSHRVEYALRRCEKEETKPMKRKTIMAIIIAVLMLALTTTAVAAVLSRTTEFFAQFYGVDYRNKLESGTTYVGEQSTTFSNVTFTLNDIISTEFKSQLANEDGSGYHELTVPFFFTTGTISAAEGENLVLLAWDEYTVDDPAGYALYYGDMYPTAPEGVPTYAEIAKEKGAVIRKVECIPNGILDENGNHYMGCVGYTLIPQEDGTVFFSVEIQPEVAVPQQDSYQLSLCICTEDVDLSGNPIEGTRQSTDWIVTLTPEAAK